MPHDRQGQTTWYTWGWRIGFQFINRYNYREMYPFYLEYLRQLEVDGLYYTGD